MLNQTTGTKPLALNNKPETLNFKPISEFLYTPPKAYNMIKPKTAHLDRLDEVLRRCRRGCGRRGGSGGSGGRSGCCIWKVVVKMIIPDSI